MKNFLEKNLPSWVKGSNSEVEEEEVVEEMNKQKFDDKENVNMAIQEEQRNNKALERTNMNNLLSKNTEDDLINKMVISLEELLKDRQLLMYDNDTLNAEIIVQKNKNAVQFEEIEKLNRVLHGREKNINNLDQQLKTKTESYDKLFKEFREYQNNSSKEYVIISNQLAMEVKKYNNFKEETVKLEERYIKQVNNLEEKIRILEIEKASAIEAAQKMKDDKDSLLDEIEAFTNRMNISL